MTTMTEEARAVRLSRLETELRQLRSELATMRTELNALTTELRAAAVATREELLQLVGVTRQLTYPENDPRRQGPLLMTVERAYLGAAQRQWAGQQFTVDRTAAGHIDGDAILSSVGNRQAVRFRSPESIFFAPQTVLAPGTPIVLVEGDVRANEETRGWWGQ